MATVELKYDEDYGQGFQRHILAVAARVPGFIVRNRDVLDHRYFVADAHRAIAEALLGHTDEREGVTPTRDLLVEEVREIVAEEDMESIEAVIKEIFSEAIHDADAVEDRVISFGRRQAMLNAVIDGADRIEKGKLDQVEGLVRDALMVGQNLLDLGTEYGEDLEARLHRYLNPESDDADHIQTGIQHLDFMLNRGLKRGELGVILAPPKRGKSTILINIGFGALCNLDALNVMHYTFEMDDKQVLRRYDDRLLGPHAKLRNKDPDKFSQALRFRQSRMTHGTLWVKRYPTRGASVDTLRSHLTLLRSRGVSPDVVIVDYAQILRPSEARKGMDYRHAQAGIYEDLRRLAGEFNCVVWTGQQANRGSLDKTTITMGDVSETFDTNAVCDAMIALCQTADEAADGVCRLFGAAIRDAEGERIIDCRIRRDQCLVVSTKLYDVAGSPVTIPGEEELDEHGNEPEPVKTKRRRAKGKGKKAKLDELRDATDTQIDGADESAKRRRRARPGSAASRKPKRRKAASKTIA